MEYRLVLLALTAVVWSGFSVPAVAVVAPAATHTYERDVWPILKTHCYQCHGEEKEHQGELDVRLRRFLVAGGESGPALVPGQPDESLLLQRIRAGAMPPGDTKVLPAEVEILEAWIRGGAQTARPEPEALGDGPRITAEEREFWAFQPIARPSLSPIEQADRVRTAIDALLLKKLNQQGLTYSEESDRRTLIRRATYDLTGLPPAPEEITQFLADQRPDAYEHLIVQLLASPHYGERWGRHWLDVAGYADSEGYTTDDPIREFAYKYRDYVIRSFNANKPFDQFIQEQLAGDEMVDRPYTDLTPEEMEKLVATGFMRMGPDGTASSEVDLQRASNDVLAETIKIVASSLYGLTIGCAQCHDHRYDPIPQTDYYQFRAIFEPAYDPKNWRAPEARRISLQSQEDRQQGELLEAEATQLDAQFQEKSKIFRQWALDRELQRVPQEHRQMLRAGFLAQEADRTDEQKALLKTYVKIANYDRISIDQFDWELRSMANFIEAEVKAKREKALAAIRSRELAKVPAGQRQLVEGAVALAVDERSPEQTALLEQFPSVVVTAETLNQHQPKLVEGIERDSRQVQLLRDQISKSTLNPLKEKAAALRAKKPKADYIRALTEVPGKVPETYFFYRGDPNEPRQTLKPSYLTVLASHDLANDMPVNGAAILGDDSTGSSTGSSTGRRLTFARHLTNGTHPMTARAVVNRIWMHHFGHGIVATPDDFGALGERPTHPQLLDWLASEFIDSGWDLKNLHRLIMTSSAYRQSSKRRDDLDAIDPHNKLYGRMSVRRLEAEVVRDSVLAVSGRLDRTMFGQPIQVMKDLTGQIIVGTPNNSTDGIAKDKIDMDGQEYRRSIYIQVRRSEPLSVLDMFDAPQMAPNCSQRSSSTVTPQALLLMNSHFAARYADDFADRLIAEEGDDCGNRIKNAWLLATGTVPDADEAENALEFLRMQTAHFVQNPIADSQRSAEHQALSNLCQALLCSNAFLYID
ncbi:MAG: PSD1 and planctomycete cytochrome C domain-containing protein [Pirellulales bacterium]